MAAYITLGAKTTHGGTVISGSPHTTHNGIPVARKGDKVSCKKCKKIVTIATGDPSFIIDGSPIARAGDVTTCGSKLIAIQQAFVQSDFEVGSIAQAAPLVFPKSNAKSFSNKDKDTSSKLEIKEVSLFKNEFVPLGIPKYGEPVAEGLKHSNFTIKVRIEQGAYNKLTILGGPNLTDIIDEQSGTFTAGQTIEIKWDGFINDIYDSKWFTDKSTRPSIKVQGINDTGSTDEHNYVFDMAFKDEKWADVVVDRAQSRIDVTIRVNIDPNIEVKGISPDSKSLMEIQSSIHYKKTGDPILKTQTKTNQQLRELVKQGMNKYWSRNSTTHTLISPNININGVIYEVFTYTVITDKNSLPKAKVTFNTNNNWGRSNSFPIFRNIFYNVGYIKEGTIWKYILELDEDKDFKSTFAHEMGHSIVWDYRGMWQSLNHEGSSTVSQKPNHSYNYPSTGELDLNKYSGIGTSDFFERVVANEDDIKGLLWVSRLEEN